MPSSYARAKTLYSAEDLSAFTLKLMLLGTGYTFNTSHDYVASLAANELSGTGYTGGYGGSGRKTIATPTLEQIDVCDQSRLLTGTNLYTWTGFYSTTVKAAAIIRETGGSDATAECIGYLDGAGFPITTVVGNAFELYLPNAWILMFARRHGDQSPPAGKKYEAYNRAGHKYSVNTLAGKTLKALLVNGSFTFDSDDEYVSDIVANELTVGGYARQTLANVTATQDNANDRAELDADDVAFGAFTGVQVANSMIVYIDNGAGDATNELVCRVSGSIFPVTTENSAKVLTVAFNAEGFLHDS